MYAKIFGQIFDGTLCTTGPWQALVTFQQLLILADKDGVVDMTPAAISRRTTIPTEIIEVGLAALLLPDPESRTPTDDGRRISPLSETRSWGWQITNYKHYRELKREEDRREYHREYWHTRKKTPTESKPEVVDSTQTQHTQPAQQNQPITEAYAKAKAEASLATQKKSSGKVKKEVVMSDQFLSFWSAWPSNRRQDKAACAEKWVALDLDASVDAILADIATKKVSRKWIDGFVELPATYINNKRWLDGLTADRVTTKGAIAGKDYGKGSTGDAF